MKYVFTQKFESWNTGDVISNSASDYVPLVSLVTLERIGVIKKVEEKKKPKFKVGDYVVVGKRFKKISEVAVYGEKFLYDGYLETSLRTPTKEELELYFR